MNEAQILDATGNLEEATAAKSNSNTIAIAVGGAMLAIGAGLGYLFGNRSGVKKGEESAKTALKEEMDALKNTVSEMTSKTTQ